jgi:hypothetical protein
MARYQINLLNGESVHADDVIIEPSGRVRYIEAYSHHTKHIGPAGYVDIGRSNVGICGGMTFRMKTGERGMAGNKPFGQS